MNDCLQSLLFLLVGLSVALCEPKTTKMREDTAQKNRILFDGSLASIQSRSIIICANQCGMTDMCMSMFYHADTKQCVLHKFLGAYLKLQQSVTTQSSGWKYYEKIGCLGLSTRSKECLISGFLYDPVVDACYITQIMNFDFDLINQHCVDLNSELIKITSQEKQDWITNKLKTNTMERICIQGNNDNINSTYQFDDGTPMTHFNWNTENSQPDGGDDHYLMMRMSVNYEWHDGRKSTGNQCVIVCEK